MARPAFAVLCYALIIAAVSGCGEDLTDVPPTLPVTGTVTLNSSPLPGATVIFADGIQYTAFGKTDDNGKFTLTMRFNSEAIREGVPPREYRVSISKMVPPDGMSEEVYEAKRKAYNDKRQRGDVVQPGDEVPPRVEMIPSRYSNAAKTELKAIVKNGQDNDFVFPLVN